MLYSLLKEAMGFCYPFSQGLDLVRGGSSRPPVLSNVMLVSVRGAWTLQDLWHHTSGVLVCLAGRSAAVVKSQVCGENTILCWAQAQALAGVVSPQPACTADGAREAAQQSEPTQLGSAPPQVSPVGAADRLQGNSPGTTCWLLRCVFCNACVVCLGEPGCGAAGIAGRRLFSQLCHAFTLV